MMNCMLRGGVRRIALAGATALLASPLATAAEFEFGDSGASLRIDTEVSAGVAVRMEDQDRLLIGRANTLANGQPGLAYSTNGDDGNLQFDRGDVVAAATKATSDISFNMGNFGAFVRASYLIDWMYKDEPFLDPADFQGPPTRTQGPADLRRAREDIESHVGNDGDILDAYVYGDFDVFDRFVAVRIGKQALNWGESTFVLNGVNSILSLDASQARVPGFEIEEVYRPVSMAWMSTELFANVSLDLFYQLDWEPTIIDPRGTYLSTNDFAGIGGNGAQLGFGRAPENAAPLTPCSDGSQCVPFGAAIPRLADREAKDEDQFGGALRMYIPALNDLDMSLYAYNFHSRLPVFNGRSRRTANDPTSDAAYQVVYPENIKLYGMSFNTTIPFGDLAVQGEYSIKIDQPLQIDDVELLLAGLGVPSQVAPIQGSALGNQEIIGFRRFDVQQINIGLTKIFGPWRWIGSEQATFLLETAGMTISDFPDQDELRLEGPGTYTPGNALTAAALGVPQQVAGYPTKSSWGYKIAGRFTYNNVFNRFVVEPTILWQHDVNGISPTPLTNFVEDRKQVNLILSGRYLNAWEAELGYTIFAGAGEQNLLGDRDYLQAVVKYTF